MRKITKVLWLIFAVAVLVFGLASCKDDSGGGGDTGTPVFDDDVIYSRYVKTTLVLGEGVSERDVSAVKTTYYRRVGKEISVGASGTHEIIVGKTDSELSARAYRYLERFKPNKEDVGYVIYSDGKNVAIAFDEAVFGENVAFGEAIDKFVSECMKSESLKLLSGVVFKDSFDAIEKQAQREEASLNRLWELKLSQILSNVQGKEKANAIIKELKGLYHIFSYDYSIVKWLANLYDPVSGGFYYSNSARNNEGYLPDLESTAQALGIVKSILTGYGGTLTDYFGEEIAAGFVFFAKNMQKENGYFYHPQWPVDLIDKNPIRRDRDVLAALNILENFGAAPTYDTPNGIKGDGEVSHVSKLVMPLRDNKVAEVSALVNSESDEIYIPPHLKSKDAFESYLGSLDINYNTEAVVKMLNSEFSLYLAVDELLEERSENYRLCDILLNFLDRKQIYSTGLWSSSNLTLIEGISLLTEIVKLYDGIGRCIPNYDNIFDTIISYLKFEEEPNAISEISGAWSALASVVNNITTMDGANRYDIESALNSIYIRFEETLKTTKEMLALFLRDDGSFSTTKEGSAHEQQGMAVALPMTEEGDMNATLLAAKNTWLSVFRVLGVGDVPIFGTSDRMMFQKTLLDMGVIIKNEIKPAKPEDFEDYNVGDTEVVDVVTNDPGENYSEIVKGPEKMGNVVALYSSKSAGQDEFHFGITSSVNGAICYSYDLDICVPPEFENGMSAFIILYKYLQMIGIERDGDTVRLLDRSSQWDAAYMRDLGVRAKVGEWFNLRVEYYNGTAETVRIKVFFNGECVAVSDTYFGKDSGELPASNYTGLAIFARYSREMKLLVDNVVTQSSYQIYIPEESNDIKINVDSPDKSQKIHDFEDTSIGSSPSGFTSPTPSAVTVTTDADNNRVLAFTEKGGELILPLDMRGSGKNSAVIEFDLVVSGDSTIGTKYGINFNEFLYKERNFAGMQILVLEDGGNKYAAIAEASDGNTGTIYKSAKLSLDTKYRLKLQLFYAEGAVVVSLDGEIIGISGNVIMNCKKYYMGETTIEALTPTLKSTIYIDNLVSESIKSDFAEVTAPDVPRVDYGFDSEDGMELSGVSPSGGVLSFDGAVGEAYVKIPVNVRVNVPTISLLELDVTKSDNGSLTLYLSDRLNNIIAAFDLVKEKDGVSVYEHTKNGRYVNPIYTINKSAFSFKLEYSPEKQGFNLFADEKYIAASSLTYTLDSGEYDFEYLRIEGSGFAIDNLYAESICGIFTTLTEASTNLDNTAPTMTYETSSFASMPNKIQLALGAVKSYLSIREGTVGEAVSKVLEFNSDGEAADIIVFKQTESISDFNAAFFETDMMIRSDGGGMNAVFEFRDESGNSINRFDIDLAQPGAALKVKEATGNDFSSTLDIKEGEWFKLRLEYRDTPSDFDYDGDNDIIFRVYINEALIGEGHSSRRVTPAALVTQIRVTVSKGMDGSVFFDNTTLGQCSVAYDAPVAPDTDTITFSPGIITDKTKPTLGSGSTASITDVTVEGEVNKVLELYSKNGNTDKLTLIPTLTLDGANAICFETDIMINPQSETATFYLEPMTEKGKQPFRLTIKATKGGDVTVSSFNKPASEVVVGKCGEWIHLKVEYMNPGVDYTGDRTNDILYKLYVDGAQEPLAVGYKLYDLGAYYIPATLTKYVFTVTSDTIAEVTFDNMRFWQVELTPDEAPEFSDTGDDALGGSSGTDDNAWS